MEANTVGRPLLRRRDIWAARQRSPDGKHRVRAWEAKNFSTRFGNGRILPQIMDAIGITLVCVAVLVVPALLLS